MKSFFPTITNWRSYCIVAVAVITMCFFSFLEICFLIFALAIVIVLDYFRFFNEENTLQILKIQGIFLIDKGTGFCLSVWLAIFALKVSFPQIFGNLNFQVRYPKRSNSSSRWKVSLDSFIHRKEPRHLSKAFGLIWFVEWPWYITMNNMPLLTLTLFVKSLPIQSWNYRFIWNEVRTSLVHSSV